MVAQARVWLLALLMVWALSHASVFGDQIEPAAKEPSAAEKIRKVLDQPMTLEFSGVTVQDIVQQLKERTRLNFVLDQYAVQQLRLQAEDLPNAAQAGIVFKSERGCKLRTALQRFLNAYNFTHVILDDYVLITSEELGLSRQLRQRVSIHVANVPLNTALKDLAYMTAVNLVVDPRIARDADVKVTLQLEDATLEATVRLLAEIGNLKAVRVGNVLFITNESRADKLRREEPVGAGP